MGTVVNIPAREVAQGPVKWCKTCGLKHPARQDCDLIEVQRVAASGKIVQRRTRPDLKKSDEQ